MGEEESTQTRPAFERHAQTALAMILVALLLWVGNTTQQTAVVVAEMRVEITYLKRQLSAPDVEHQMLERRVDVLERSVTELNGEHRK